MKLSGSAQSLTNSTTHLNFEDNETVVGGNGGRSNILVLKEDEDGEIPSPLSSKNSATKDNVQIEIPSDSDDGSEDGSSSSGQAFLEEVITSPQQQNHFKNGSLSAGRESPLGFIAHPVIQTMSFYNRQHQQQNSTEDKGDEGDEEKVEENDDVQEDEDEIEEKKSPPIKQRQPKEPNANKTRQLIHNPQRLQINQTIVNSFQINKVGTVSPNTTKHFDGGKLMVTVNQQHQKPRGNKTNKNLHNQPNIQIPSKNMNSGKSPSSLNSAKSGEKNINLTSTKPTIEDTRESLALSSPPTEGVSLKNKTLNKYVIISADGNTNKTKKISATNTNMLQQSNSHYNQHNISSKQLKQQPLLAQQKKQKQQLLQQQTQHQQKQNQKQQKPSGTWKEIDVTGAILKLYNSTSFTNRPNIQKISVDTLKVSKVSAKPKASAPVKEKKKISKKKKSNKGNKNKKNKKVKNRRVHKKSKKKKVRSQQKKTEESRKRDSNKVYTNKSPKVPQELPENDASNNSSNNSHASNGSTAGIKGEDSRGERTGKDGNDAPSHPSKNQTDNIQKGKNDAATISQHKQSKQSNKQSSSNHTEDGDGTASDMDEESDQMKEGSTENEDKNDKKVSGEVPTEKIKDKNKEKNKANKDEGEIKIRPSSSQTNTTDDDADGGDDDEKMEKLEMAGQHSDEDDPQKNQQNDETRTLQKTLSKLRFNNGAPAKVHPGQQFSYISQCGLYTEPQNVSQTQHSWVTKTYAPYFYLYEKPKDYEKCKPSDWMFGKDMRGSVFLSFEVKSLHGSNLTNNAKICEKYCCKEPRCEAWVVRFQEDASNNCPDKSFCCWLKNDIPPIEDYYLEGASVAGVVHRNHYRSPPTGMRSAVPLGGLAAGSFEMRADGTFHEWTIENQSPGGSAKLSKSALDKMFLGVRVKKGSGKNNTKAAILKTHSMKGFENETVKSLQYFGAHPVSKFSVELSDDEKQMVDLNLYAFSPFHPRDATESATPAVSFTLEVRNPSEEEAIDVSFMLNLPFGYNEDTVRKGGNYQEADFSRVITPEDCQRECAKRADCQSWTTNGPNTCMLKDTIPLHSFNYGIVSGIRTDWDVNGGLLSCQRPGFSPQSGDVTLYPVQSGSEDQSFVVTDNVTELWKNFKKYGQVNGNASNTLKLNKTGLHGAVSLNTHVKPKETKLLTIIFSWYFPNKDIADERVGNFYSNLFKNSSQAAKHFQADLVDTVKDIVNWHSAVFTSPPPSSTISPQQNVPSENETSTGSCSTQTDDGVSTLPVCLQDILVNSLSFLRTAMWFENGRWRQWEALDCANLDPVHIDFHRIIPYMIFYPDLVKQLMFSWADHQMTNLENGMIQESLSQGCLEESSKDGLAGGRQMTDVNVAFITQAYLVFSWTNDTDFFHQIYPFAKRATHWLINRSTKNSGLPHRKADTYDLFELEKYDHSAYNSILYLLALKAMSKMANLKNDWEVLSDVDRALKRAEKLFDVEMWDQRRGFYHAWFDDEWGSPGWLMTDIFYGQVWAYSLGLGDLVDVEKMKKHLKKEVSRNDSPYGLMVLTKSEETKQLEDTSIILGEETNSCKSLENITKTNSVWMSSSADWSTLQLHLGMDPKKAMSQAIKSLDNYRSNLRDQWNFHGMTSSSHYGQDGLPWATSHYTLHLVMWHLPLALSGQQYYAPEGRITFAPKYSPPYSLPFYTPSCIGKIEAKSAAEKSKASSEILYTVNVSSGHCRFEELTIGSSRYSGSVDLGEGDSLSWSTPKSPSNREEQDEKIQSMLDQLKKHR